jgi:hypothetical protein
MSDDASGADNGTTPDAGTGADDGAGVDAGTGADDGAGVDAGTGADDGAGVDGDGAGDRSGAVLGPIGLAAGVAAVVVLGYLLFVQGDATVSTAPFAVAATVVGLAAGAALQLGSYRTDVGQRLETAYREHWPYSMFLVFAVIFGAWGLLSGQQFVDANRAAIYQFLFAAFVGSLGVQAVLLARLLGERGAT